MFEIDWADRRLFIHVWQHFTSKCKEFTHNNHGCSETTRKADTSNPGLVDYISKASRACCGLKDKSGRLNVSELFFEVPKDHANPSHGSLRLFARSVERFESPVDASKKEVKQPPWCKHYTIQEGCYNQ